MGGARSAPRADAALARLEAGDARRRLLRPIAAGHAVVKQTEVRLAPLKGRIQGDLRRRAEDRREHKRRNERAFKQFCLCARDATKAICPVAAAAIAYLAERGERDWARGSQPPPALWHASIARCQ